MINGDLSTLPKPEFKFIMNELRKGKVKLWEPEILVIDNFLPIMEYNDCVKEIEKNRSEMKPENIFNGHATFERWYPGVGTIIPQHIDSYLFNDKIFDAAVNFRDGFWKLFTDKIANGFEVQVTSYKKERNNKYDWHVDHQVSSTGFLNGVRILNYILYMNDIDEGGEFEIADFYGKYVLGNYKSYKKIKVKKNRLVLTPSWYIHKVNTVKTDQERLTINGHIYLQPISTIIQNAKYL